MGLFQAKPGILGTAMVFEHFQAKAPSGIFRLNRGQKSEDMQAPKGRRSETSVFSASLGCS